MMQERGFKRDASTPTSSVPADTRDAPSIAETIFAGGAVARADTTGYSQLAEMAAYDPIVDALEELGEDRDSFVWKSKYSSAGGTWDREKIYRAVQRQRQRGHFKDLPNTYEAFEKQWRADKRKEIAVAEDTSSRGNAVARFVGGIGGAMSDPLNILTLGFGGGGKTIAAKVLTEAGVNMGIEALLTPGIQGERAALGRDAMTGSEIAQNVLLAGAGAAAIRGGIEIAPKIDAAGYRIAAPVRESIDGKLADRDVARAFSDAVPVFDRTPEQQAAINIITRADEVDSANPFRNTYDGIDAHRSRLTEAMESIEAGRVAPAQPAAPAVATPARVEPAAGPIRASGGVADFAAVKNAIRKPESGVDDRAVNKAGSSASGRYQFIKGTFVGLYQRVYSVSEAKAISAWNGNRFDVRVQEQLMDQLLKDNASALSRAGFAADQGNLYVAHVMGNGGALAALRANPEMPVADLIRKIDPKNAKLIIRQNPTYFGGGKTVGQSLGIIRSKVGGEGAGNARTGGSGAAEEFLPGAEDDLARALDLEAADLAAQRGRLGEGGSDDYSVKLDDDVEPADLSIDPMQLERGVDDAMAEIVATRGVSLNRLGDLSGQLEVDEGAVRKALDRMVGRGELRQTASGQYRRIPAAVATPREDLARFVTNRGGLAYDGLNAKSRKNGSIGHDLRNSGNMDHFVPGAGKMLRPTGRSLDEMAELAWEQGYFGPPETSPRPTETEFMAMLDQSIGSGEKIFAAAEDAAAAADPKMGKRGRFQSAEQELAERARWNGAAKKVLGRALTDDEFFAGFDMVGAPGREGLPQRDGLDLDYDGGEDLAPYVVELVNRKLDDALEDFAFENEDEFNALVTGQFEAAFGEGRDGRIRGGEQVGDEGNAGQGQGGGSGRPGDPAAPNEGSGQELTGALADALDAEGLRGDPLPDEHLTRQFADPDSEGIARTAESDWHDIRAQVSQGDPSIQARQVQEAQLRADAPLRGESATGEAQDGTMGAPLFDAADAPKFDLEDGKGPRTASDIDDELTAGEAAIAAARNCLK